MKNIIKGMVIIASLCLLSFPAICETVNLTNQGFETDSLEGWSWSGDVTVTSITDVVTDDNTVWTVASHGNSMAQLNSNPILNLDAFFGLTNGTINSVVVPVDVDGADAVTNGAGIKQDFNGNIGDTLTMFWDFIARDVYPFNDTAFAVIKRPSGSTVRLLASIVSGGIAVGTSGTTDWQNFTYILPENGDFTIGFGVVNTGDTRLDAALFLDSAPGTQTTVPEPATMLLLGLGLVGLAGARRKFKK